MNQPMNHHRPTTASVPYRSILLHPQLNPSHAPKAIPFPPLIPSTTACSCPETKQTRLRHLPRLTFQTSKESSSNQTTARCPRLRLPIWTTTPMSTMTGHVGDPNTWTKNQRQWTTLSTHNTSLLARPHYLHTTSMAAPLPRERPATTTILRPNCCVGIIIEDNCGQKEIHRGPTKPEN